MSHSNTPGVREIFPHTITVTLITSPRAAYDLILWCIDNFIYGWNKVTLNDIVYIQMVDERDLTLFLLTWAEDKRIQFNI